MHIKPDQGFKSGHTQSARNGALSSSRATPLLLIGIACLTAVVAAGIWYAQEGHEIIGPLLLGRRARTGAGDGLPTLHVQLSPDAYQTMYRHWQESLQTGVLPLDESEWMQGKVRAGRRSVPASIWLKQESPEHWQETKWSLRIQLGDRPGSLQPTTLLGMESFVARSPATGRYLDDWLYSEDLRRAGVLAPRHVFVHLWVNGDNWGVYALQETLSNTFLTSQKRVPGISLRVDDSAFGRQQARSAGLLPGLVQPSDDSSAAIQRDPALREQYAAAVGLLYAYQRGQLRPSQVFDAEQVGRYLAHAQWWGARYGPQFEREQYYYDALASRLEPIGGGALPLEPAYSHSPSLAQYDDLEIMQAYVQEVQRIARPDYLESLQATYQDSFRRYQAALAQEFPADALDAPWPMLTERQAILYRSLYPQRAVHAYATRRQGSLTLDLHLANLSNYPLLLDGIRMGDRLIDVQGDWIANGQGLLLHSEALSSVALRPLTGSIPSYVTVHVPESTLGEFRSESPSFSGIMQLVTHLPGLEAPHVVDVQLDDLALPSPPAIPAPLSVEQTLARHAFLAPGDRPGFLTLKPGDWNVTGDLVLPDGYGLSAQPPVVLRFDPGAVLLANGPLLLDGSAGNEVHLVPKESDWGGVVVLDAGAEALSSLSYATIRAASGVRRQGWQVPGGVAFVKSPVALSHCRLMDTTAPSALYVAHANFACGESEFGRASDSALFSEYAEGRIVGCRFHDVLGTAIKARGSQLVVDGVSLMRVYDQGISAGRNSVVTVRGGRAEDVGLAVASADASHVQVEDLFIKQAWTAGLAAYTGQPENGPASIHASDIVFESERAVQALVQTGNSVRLDGVAAGARELDVQRLSWRHGVTATIRPLGYRLGPAIWLAGYHVDALDLAPGEALHVTLYWRSIDSLDRDYTVFVHIRDAAGETVAGWDAMPRQNAYPTTQWEVGHVIDDRHDVPLDLPAGDYNVALGLYHLASGERLSVYGPDGEPVAGDAVVLDQGFRVN